MTTFKVALADVLVANSPYLPHVERTHSGVIALYAAMPRSTQPPIRVRRDLQIKDGFRRLCAARLRGDMEILCYPASLQEELSA